MRNLYDIDAVIRKSGVDWTRLVSTAQEWGVERVTWLTLHMLEDIAGTSLPRPRCSQRLRIPSRLPR
jgi:hypothetical protein